MYLQELSHRADVRIGEDIDGTVSGVSGGERRRVSVGIALVTDPRVVFLDEPTTGLDSDSALTLVKVLKRLAEQGRTVGSPTFFLFFSFGLGLKIPSGIGQVAAAC